MSFSQNRTGTIVFLLMAFLLSATFVNGQGGTAKIKLPFGHSGSINIIRFSANGKYILTGGSDGTIIIWDVKTGKELRNLLIKSPVQDLQILSDSKQFIVASGTERSRRAGLVFSLWDLRSGEKLKQYPFYGGVGFSFSPEDNTLLIPYFSTSLPDMKSLLLEGFADTMTLATYDIGNNKLLKTFTVHINDASGSDGNTMLKFIHNKGKLYFLSPGERRSKKNGGDYTLNIWNTNNDTRPEKTVTAKDYIRSLAASSATGIFATASKSTVFTWNINTNMPTDSFVPVQNQVKQIGLSKDGNQLFCLSTTRGNRESTLQVWEINSHREILSFNVPEDLRYSDFYFAPDGRNFIFCRYARAFLCDKAGNSMYTLSGHVTATKKMYFSGNNRFLSPKTHKGGEGTRYLEMMNAMIETSKKIAGDSNINKEQNRQLNESIQKLSASMNNINLAQSHMPAFDLYTGAGFSATRMNSDLVYKGVRLAMTEDTVSADKKLLLLNNELRPALNDNLDAIAAIKNNNETAGKVEESLRSMMGNIEPDSKLKIIINKTTNDTLSLIFLDGSEWMVLNNKGYYKASKNAVALLHYVTNDGKVFSFEQLDLKYNRPDIILQALGSKDKALIEAYRKSYSNRLARYNMDVNSFGNDNAVPEADFSEREKIEYNQQGGKMNLRINAVSGSSSLRRFNLWINEVPLFGSTGIDIARDPKRVFDTSISIVLSAGKNKIETSVFNASGYESYRYPLFVNNTATNTPKPKTWFVGVGVNKYADPQHNNLKYTLEDIRSMVNELQQKTGNEIMVDTMFNSSFSIENLEKVKAKLSGAGINDKVILMYSGHGVLGNDGKYYFPTSAMDAQDFAKPGAKSVSYEVMESLLDGIPARNKLFLIDACHSGVYDAGTETVLDSTTTSVLMDELFTYVGRGTGATVIASSSGQANSLESATLRHGFFTQSILYTIKQFQSITVSELKDITISQVPLLSNNRQIPTVRSENREADFRVW